MTTFEKKIARMASVTLKMATRYLAQRLLGSLRWPLKWPIFTLFKLVHWSRDANQASKYCIPNSWHLRVTLLGPSLTYCNGSRQKCSVKLTSKRHLGNLAFFLSSCSLRMPPDRNAIYTYNGQSQRKQHSQGGNPNSLKGKGHGNFDLWICCGL